MTIVSTTCVVMVVVVEEMEQQLQRIGNDEYVINVVNSRDRKSTQFL